MVCLNQFKAGIFCFLFLIKVIPCFSQIHPKKPQEQIKGWEEIQTVEDIVKAYPQISGKIIHDLDLSHPGLEEVKEAINDRDTVEALQNLVDHYRNVNNAECLITEKTNPTNEIKRTANNALNNIFTFQLVKGRRNLCPKVGIV